MRILLDMQAAQSGSRNRGIGRYSRAFLRALIRNGTEHEIHVSLSRALWDTVDELQRELRSLLPRGRIRVFEVLADTAESIEDNLWRSRASQLLRESFHASLNPDVTHTSSLFEGLTDDAAVSIGMLRSDGIQSVTLYDLIPHADPGRYLPSPMDKKWYSDRLASLERADLLLAISEYSRKEAIDTLRIPENRVVAVHADADPVFRKLSDPSRLGSEIREKFSLDKPFILFTGVIAKEDPRKNCGSLLQAYAQLPMSLRAQHKLVLVGSVHGLQDLSAFARTLGLREDEWNATDWVSDDELVLLYNACKLFVFPSTHEGFGLPVLEAMRCGAPVIASNATSIPEVAGSEMALFDPLSVASISKKLREALVDDDLRSKLRDLAAEQAKKFSWDQTARLALAAFEETCKGKRSRPASTTHNHTSAHEEHDGSLVGGELLSALTRLNVGQPSQKDIKDCARALSRNSMGSVGKTLESLRALLSPRQTTKRLHTEQPLSPNAQRVYLELNEAIGQTSQA